MLWFFSKKPLRVTADMMFFGNAAQRVLDVIYGLAAIEDVRLIDFTLKPGGFSKIPAPDGGKCEVTVVTGHYGYLGSTYKFRADIHTRYYDDDSVCLDYDATHVFVLNDKEYRVHWSSPDKFAFQRWTGDIYNGWTSSDEVLRLDQLPFGKVSSQRVEATLYALNIRTLGHLLQWTESQLLKETGDISIVAGARNVLSELGYGFKSETAR